MSWLENTIRSSLRGLLGRDQALEGDDVELQVQRIQQAMLDALHNAQAGPEQGRLRERIIFAADAKTLWYLRGDLFHVLTDAAGPGSARQRLDAISSMFAGVLPPSMRPRPRKPVR